MRFASGRWFLAGSALAGAASAAAPSTRFFLEFDAPAGCPSEVTFRSQVMARTSAAEFSESRSGARRLSVLIAKLDGGYLGRLAIESTGASPTSREVEAGSCDEVVAALALTTSLNIDGPAAESGRGPVTASPARSSVLSLGAQAAAAGVPSGLPSPRFGAFAELFAPDQGFGARLLGAYGYGDVGGPEQGGVDLSLLTARLSVCPFEQAWFLRVSSCGFAELGALLVEGRDVVGPRSETRPWLAAGVEVWLRYPSTGGWFVAGGIELDLPVIRHRFRLQDNSELYAVPRVTGALGLSLGVHLE